MNDTQNTPEFEQPTQIEHDDNELKDFIQFMSEPDLQDIARQEQHKIFIGFANKVDEIDVGDLHKKIINNFEKEESASQNADDAFLNSADALNYFLKMFSLTFLDAVREISPLTEYMGWEHAHGVDDNMRDYVAELLANHFLDKFYEAAIPILAKLFCEMLASASPATVSSYRDAFDESSKDYGIPDYDPLDYNPGGAK